jgi:hypothetical protein
MNKAVRSNLDKWSGMKGLSGRDRRILMKIGLTLCTCLMFLVLCATKCPYTGAEWNPTGNPIGGGPGYSDSIRHQAADYVVHNIVQLSSALSAADYGSVIYIWDTCRINMNGLPVKFIPPWVTVASGRGRTLNDTVSWGALLYYDSVDAIQWEMLRFNEVGKSRITGIRFRGSYSCVERRPLGDSFNQPVHPEMAICIASDSCVVDNCEFWGFGSYPVYVTSGKGSYVHHNFFHHGSHVYPGYGFCVDADGEVVLEANYWDYHGCHIAGGGSSTNSRYEARYNICGSHAEYNVFDRHGTGITPQLASADYIHHNTVRFNGYVSGNVTGYWLRGYAVDSILVHNNWFWDTDSASSIHLYNNSDSMCRIWDNHFTEIPPQGVSEKMPIAHVFASVDSGSPPLTVTFKARGSYDPDGKLRAFYWNFGDSSGFDNHARYTEILDSTQHTYHEVGLYRVELMITDDAGIPASAYRDIRVAPSDNRNLLSAWVKDNYHGDKTGYYSLQVLVDDWVLWEKDVAGEGDWEHIIVDVTDSLAGKERVTLALRLFCKKDTSEFQNIGLKTFWDDIFIFGANVKNGNFESGPWTGSAERTDGNWIPSRSTYYYCWDYRADERSGVNSYFLGRMYSDLVNAGDFCQIEQIVSVGPLSGQATEVDSFVFYVNPNPMLSTAAVNYAMLAQSDVSIKIYDDNGRLVKKLVDDKKAIGSYRIDWDGYDDNKRKVANGVYFCRFEASPVGKEEQYVDTEKVVFLK